MNKGEIIMQDNESDALGKGVMTLKPMGDRYVLPRM